MYPWGEIGMSAASDAEILEYAAANSCIVATLDADLKHKTTCHLLRPAD
jgi:predicted nuclease of predicted toxin-antitoxin system